MAMSHHDSQARVLLISLVFDLNEDAIYRPSEYVSTFSTYIFSYSQ